MRKYALLVPLLLVSGLMLQACGRQLSPEPGCNFVQNGALQRVSWKKKVPVRFYIHNSVSHPEHIEAMKTAAQIINKAMGEQYISIEATFVSGSLGAKRDGYNMIYWRKDWDADQPTEQARTTVHWSGNVLYDTDIMVNAKNFEYFTGEQAQAGKVHLESLMVHEMLHALGLAHTDQHDSVMVTTLSPGKIRTEIQKVDLDSLACEYN